VSEQARETKMHSISIPVTENVEHGLYLRESLGEGKAGEREVEISRSGTSIIVQIGGWRKPGGRQFLIDISDLVRGVVEQVASA
jgi:hypothetical protein